MASNPKKFFFDTSEMGLGNTSGIGTISIEEYVLLDIIGIFVSIVGFPTNIAILYIIYMSPSLKTKCFLLIGALGAVDILYAFQYFLSHFYSMGQMLDLWANNLSTTICLFFSFFFYSSMENMITCIIACDRLYAMLAPARYYNAGKHMTKLMLSACLSLGALNLCLVFGFSARPDKVHCGLMSPLTPAMAQYFMGSIMLWNVSALILYLTVVLVARQQLTRMQQNPNAAANQYLQGHLRMLPAVHVILFIHFVTMVIPAVLVLGLMPILGDSIALKRVSCWGGLFAVFNPGFNFFFYYWRSTEFRKCTKVLFVGSAGVGRVQTPAAGSARAGDGTNLRMGPSRGQLGKMFRNGQRVQPL